MTHSPQWWNASGHVDLTECRIEWRPSRWVAINLLALVLLAVLALWRCELPGWAQWTLSLLVLSWGGGDLLRYLHLSPQYLQIPQGAASPCCNGQPMQSLHVQWRGPFVFCSWRSSGGSTCRLVCGPETLTAMQRRELRLAMQQYATAKIATTVAG